MKKGEEKGKGKRKGVRRQFSTEKGKKREKMRQGDREDVELSNGATRERDEDDASDCRDGCPRFPA